MIDPVLTREDLIDYCDGETQHDVSRQRKILSILTNSPESRRHLEQVRRKLYQIEVKIPDYRNTDEFTGEVTRLAMHWFEKRNRRQAVQELQTKRPVAWTYLFVFSLLLLLVTAVWLLSKALS